MLIFSNLTTTIWILLQNTESLISSNLQHCLTNLTKYKLLEQITPSALPLNHSKNLKFVLATSSINCWTILCFDLNLSLERMLDRGLASSTSRWSFPLWDDICPQQPQDQVYESDCIVMVFLHPYLVGIS